MTAELPLSIEAWARATVAALQALSPADRQICVDDARAGNPRRHRLAWWVDYRGAIVKIADAHWTIVEEREELTPGGQTVIYQIALHTHRGAFAMGPLRAVEQPQARR